MTKAQINQILIATVATVAAGVVLDYLRKPKKQDETAPPVVDDKPWYGYIFGTNSRVNLF